MKDWLGLSVIAWHSTYFIKLFSGLHEQLEQLWYVADFTDSIKLGATPVYNSGD